MIAQKFAPETPPAVTPATPEPRPPVEAPAQPPPPTPEPAPASAKKADFTEAEIEAAQKENPDHKAWKILKFVKGRAAANEAAWNAEKTKLEGRPQTPANDERIAQLEKMIEEGKQETKTWKQRVEEADFTRSEEYTNKFVNPYQSERKRALEEVKGLTVSFTQDGEPQTRQATESDFTKAMSLPPSEQDDYIHATFGKSAWRVMNRINELNRIKEAANNSVTEFAANYEKNKTTRELDFKRQRDEYEKALAEAHSGFQKDPELGKYLTEAETDPEGTKLFKTALEKFDSFKTVQPTAADAAEVRASYAMKPRLLHENKQLSAKVASLEAELAKLRGVDPGQAVKTVTGSAAVTPAKGVDGLIAGLKWGTP